MCQSVTTHRERSLQLASDCAEAVEHKVLSHTVDPLSTGRQRATHKVTAFPFTGAETPHDLHTEGEKFTSNTHETHRQPAHRPQWLMFCADLALHVHDDHRVGAVAHHKVFRVLGQQEDVVDGDVGASRGAQRFEGVGALGGLHVPHLVPGHTHTHTSIVALTE